MFGLTSVWASARGALLMAAVSTVADYFWAVRVIPDHRPIWGILHGAILFFCLGLILGLAGGKPRGWLWGALGGVLIGAGASGAFYLLVRTLGYATMLGLWVAVWILFGMLQGRLSASAKGLGEIALRGLLAATTSAVGFWAIYQTWRKPSPAGPDYLVNFLYWTLAYLPALLALLVSRSSGRRTAP